MEHENITVNLNLLFCVWTLSNVTWTPADPLWESLLSTKWIVVTSQCHLILAKMYVCQFIIDILEFSSFSVTGYGQHFISLFEFWSERGARTGLALRIFSYSFFFFFMLPLIVAAFTFLQFTLPPFFTMPACWPLPISCTTHKIFKSAYFDCH